MHSRCRKCACRTARASSRGFRRKCKQGGSMSKLGKNSGRRWFLKSVSAIGAAVPAAAALGADPHAHHLHGEQLAQAARAKAPLQPQAYGWLTAVEASCIEAAGGPRQFRADVLTRADVPW